MMERTMPLGRSMNEQAKTSVSRSPQGNLAKGPGGSNGVGMPKKGNQSRGGAHSPAPHNLLKRTGKSNQGDPKRSTSATVRLCPGHSFPACLLAAAAAVALIQCNVHKQKQQHTGHSPQGTQGVRVREMPGPGGCCRRYSKLALNCSKGIPKHQPFSRSDAFKDLCENKRMRREWERKDGAASCLASS